MRDIQDGRISDILEINKNLSIAKAGQILPAKSVSHNSFL